MIGRYRTTILNSMHAWKLVDEFSGYLIHKKTRHVGQKITVEGLIAELSS